MEDAEFVEYIVDQVSDLLPMRVMPKAMFGGWGLYADEIFFGIVHGGVLYLKTNVHTRKRYEHLGMKPFVVKKGQVLKNYFEVPEEVLEDQDELVNLVEESIHVAGGL